MTSQRPASWQALLLAIAATLAAVIALAPPAITASAATVPAAWNGVGASRPAMILAVGASRAVCAGEGRGEAGLRAHLVSGACVAAEDAGAAGDTAAARGGVYTLRDEAGNVVRTGRSSNLAAREAAHFNDPVLGQFEFQVEYRTDVYAEQRGLEQLLYDQYPGAQAANGGYNMIRGISPLNPNGPGYMQAAYDYLGRLTGGG